MQLPNKAIQEFKDIFEKERGREITWEEATEWSYNLIGFYKLLVDSEMEDRRRKRRLETEPKGFPIDGEGRNCPLCYSQTSGRDQMWYDKCGMKCMTCQKALDKKKIPASIFKDEDKKTWYSMSEFDWYFGVKPPTIRKFVREGKLKMRTVPNESGRIHFEYFLIKDNPGILPNKPRSCLVTDSNGWSHTEYEKVLFPLIDSHE